ncbi:unnamed protein product [Lampetra planeri]
MADGEEQRRQQEQQQLLRLPCGADEERWRAVSLTHVEFPPGDMLGKALAWCSLAPIFIVFGFVTLIAFKRELHTIAFMCGLLVNEGLNWVIKHVIREPRPNRDCREALFTEYGMPSSHAQFVWFFAVYSFLFLYFRMHHTTNARCVDLLWRHVLSVALLLLAICVTYSRVYLLYHSGSQVVYGAFAGTVMAVAWFGLTQEILTPIFPFVASWPVSEFLLLRDTSLIPNILWFEYTVTRSESRARQRKQGVKSQ